MSSMTGPRTRPLTDRELDELQVLLDSVPAPLEALDVSMLDGYLVGVLLQPRPISAERWLPHLTDVDGRPLPPRFDATRLHVLARRRHGELESPKFLFARDVLRWLARSSARYVLQ